jgi:hypothetical protein
MFPVKGVESIEFAPVSADGTLPTTGWVKFTDIEEGSVSFNIPEPALTKVRVEDKPGTWAIVGEEGDGASVTGKSLNLDPKIADLLFKGIAASTATTKFEAPVDPTVNVQLAVRVTSRPRLGFKMVFVILNGAVVARIENPLTKTGADFLALGFTAEATSVTDADGDIVSPWYYEKVAVA